VSGSGPAASIKRELLGANPMPVIGRPKVPKSLPKSDRTETVAELVAAIDADQRAATTGLSAIARSSLPCWLA